MSDRLEKEQGFEKTGSRLERDDLFGPNLDDDDDMYSSDERDERDENDDE